MAPLVCLLVMAFSLAESQGDPEYHVTGYHIVYESVSTSLYLESHQDLIMSSPSQLSHIILITFSKLHL